MASRIFWVLVAGIALVTGMLFQDGDRIFAWGHEAGITERTEQAIQARVERAVEGSVDKMQVIGTDGREIDVPPETRRALGDAVGRLVRAETELAVLRIRDGSPQERRAAEARRAEARAEVDRLKAEIKGQDRAAVLESEAVSEQVERQVREDVRATVRDAVRN